jgi:hypothetical protein
VEPRLVGTVAGAPPVALDRATMAGAWVLKALPGVALLWAAAETKKVAAVAAPAVDQVGPGPVPEPAHHQLTLPSAAC